MSPGAWGGNNGSAYVRRPEAWISFRRRRRPVRRLGLGGAGAGLSQQADSRADRLCAGRFGGRWRAPARPGARAAARPAAHHREQTRQRGRRGDGVHGPRAGRRLHALLLRQRAPDRRAPSVQGGIQQRDVLTHLGHVCGSGSLLVVHPSTPFKSVADVVAISKREPSKWSYGTSGVGGPHHLWGNTSRA